MTPQFRELQRLLVELGLVIDDLKFERGLDLLTKIRQQAEILELRACMSCVTARLRSGGVSQEGHWATCPNHTVLRHINPYDD